MDIRCQEEIPVGFERRIRGLLRHVPAEHLAGLSTIVLLDWATDSEHQRAAGLYSPAWGQRPAVIELALKAIYGNVPRAFFFVPFVSSFMLAGALYHEIGHHYQQRLAHGVGREEREAFADRYKKQMLQRAFPWWRIALLPLKPLVRLLGTDTRNRGEQDP